MGKIPAEILRKLPKAELHCHLDGSVRPSTILELAEEQGIELPASTESELRKLVEVSMDCTSLSEYLGSFAITLKVLQKPYAITRAMYELAEDARRDGVRYIEVRFSPVLHVQEGMSLSGVMEAVCEGRLLAESRLGVVTRVIVCGMRHMDPSVSESLAEIAWRYKDRGVVAFDLAGPETGNSSKVHKSAFDIVRRHHINCTIHAGEEPKAGWQSIWDSIRHCGAHRIGHGVQLRHNRALRDFVVDQKIGVEVCITSNMQTKAIHEAKEHPLREFFDAGVKIVPCTDNRTVSGIDLTHEYELIQDQLGFEPWEILAMMDNGFSCAFVGYTERRRLRADCFHDALRLLVSAGIDTDPVLEHFADALELGDLRAVVADAKDAERSGRRRYWRGIDVPRVTEAMIAALPKTDLHCRLDGSVTPAFVAAELAAMDQERAAAMVGAAEKRLRQQPSGSGSPDGKKGVDGDHTAAAYEARVARVFASRACRSDAKSLIRKVLRHTDQDAEDCPLRRGVYDVLDQCAADGVTYVELMVRPWVHFECDPLTGAGDTVAPACVIDAVRRYVHDYCTSDANKTRGFPVHAAVVIYATHPEDDPVRVRALADIAIEAGKVTETKGMCRLAGLALYGEDLPESGVQYHLSTFAHLKAHHVRVAVSAGSNPSDPSTGAGQVSRALKDLGATRLGKALVSLTDAETLGHLGDHRTPIELGPTDLLEDAMGGMRSFMGGHPFRMFVDRGLCVAVCSVERSFGGKSISAALAELMGHCYLTISDLLELLANGCGAGFRARGKGREAVRQLMKAAASVFEGYPLLRHIYFEPKINAGVLADDPNEMKA